ncbi:unnamed protein product [Brassica rapa]|uniref:Uncharacterized protein n=1 Tax=Brassica campestris TaxID=3711 RepID=A0A8D9FXZ4_BRACM|nr:unnamed protein product [Brassica rapa]
MSSIALIWYKLPSKELKDLKYVFDTMNDDMVEHKLQGRNNEVENGDECVNRLREDDDGEESKDEQPVAEEEDEIQQEAD